MSFPNYQSDYISEQDYLEREKISETKHEYFDGEIFAMAGASRSHQRIISNLVIDIGTHLKNTQCEVFSSDMKVRADKGKKYFYPDVLVSCTKGDGDSHFEESPRIIVEVLSNSTRKFDQTLKRLVYQSITTLEEYVLIEQDRVEIQVFRRADNWQSSYYYIDDDITFTSIGLTLPVLEIYQRVENDDMRAFNQTQENPQ
ncbi:MAG: Uma2 family endonuclease [Methylococcaceae bacterium]